MIDNKYAAVVVTFYPDKQCFRNIRSIARSAHLLIVIDNTPEPINFFEVEAPNIQIFQKKRNIGLAKALNEGVGIAGDLGFENIFLLDQDSHPVDHFFTSMLTFKHQIDDAIANCAFYVPNFIDRNSQTTARFPVLTPFSIRHRCCNRIKPFYPNKTVIAITSGTLITFKRFKEIGPFPEEYFIDFIDNEYCLRAAIKKLTVAVNCAAILKHSIGCRKKRHILGLRITPNYHNAIRRYYIARNGFFTSLRYFPSFPSFFFLVCIRLVHELLSIILFESKKTIKIKALIIGLKHGVTGRMGIFNLSGGEK